MKKVRMGCLRQKEKENALNEIRILASIQDPNIIGYKEAFLDEGSNSLCVIMEFAAEGDIGKQIQQAIRKTTLIEEKEIWKALIHMTLGLRVLHKAGILHRDLKSANIFKSGDGSYKLGDMNVSKVSHGALAKTQTGTPYYASPEVWRDKPYSSPSDIWSLGCVIYEMATLKPPFRAQDLKTLFKKVSAGVYDKLPKIYSKELNNILAAMLKVPAHLRPTCDQILNDPSVKQYSDQIMPKTQEQSKAELLQTILLPKNLKQLQAQLPKPTYDQQKSNRSSSVQDRSKSQTPQPLHKEPSISKPKIPLGPKQNILQQAPPKPKGCPRPSSGMRAQSPSQQIRKSVERRVSEIPHSVKNKSPSNRVNRYDENTDRNCLGPRKSSAQQLRKQQQY